MSTISNNFVFAGLILIVSYYTSISTCQSDRPPLNARSLLVPILLRVTSQTGDARRGGVRTKVGSLKSGITTQKSTREQRNFHHSPAIHQHQLPLLLQRADTRVDMAPISITSVLISESVDPRCRAILEENGIRVTEKQNMKKDELIAEIKVRAALRNVQPRLPFTFPGNEKFCRSAELHLLQSSAR